MKKISLFLVFFTCLLTTACVESQNFVALENRVAAMEMENNRQMARQNDETQEQQKKKIEAIERTLAQRPGITKEEYAEIRYEIQDIRGMLGKLEGRIQELGFEFEQFAKADQQEVDQTLERLDHAISKNYEKVIRLEKYMGFEPSAAELPGLQSDLPQSDALQPAEENPEQKLYGLAKKLFDEGDRENARIQFENFINKFPESDNADNARFWIADSYYAEKWFEKAILEYQKVLEEYPDSNKQASARLKQGYAFAELGEYANARLILKELIKKHPDSNESRYAAEKLKNLK